MRTVAAAFIVVVGLFFIGLAVVALIRNGLAGILGAVILGFFGIANLRVARYILDPDADTPEKLS